VSSQQILRDPARLDVKRSDPTPLDWTERTVAVASVDFARLIYSVCVVTFSGGTRCKVAVVKDEHDGDHDKPTDGLVRQ
jgi:hypothetical protein